MKPRLPGGGKASSSARSSPAYGGRIRPHQVLPCLFSSTQSTEWMNLSLPAIIHPRDEVVAYGLAHPSQLSAYQTVAYAWFRDDAGRPGRIPLDLAP